MTERNDHYGNDARLFTPTEKVINRWTTLLLPSTTAETWIKATEQEPALRLLKHALQTKTIPLRSLFTNKKYHNELTSHQLCLENGMIYQSEQPMATRIRQLQRKVVPWTPRPTILAGLPCDTVIWTHGCVQDLLAHCSKILMVRDETRYTQGSTRMPIHCRVANA